MDDENRFRPLVYQYLRKIQVKRVLALGRTGAIFDAAAPYVRETMNRFEPTEASRDRFYRALAGDHNSIADVLSDAALNRFLDLILPGAEASRMRLILQRLPDYPYMNDLNRRPFRTGKNLDLWLGQAAVLLYQSIVLQACSFNLDAFLENGRAGVMKDAGCEKLIAHRIALAIDQGEASLFDKAKRIISEDATTGVVTWELIAGFLMSHDPRAHRCVGDLLLAARLQEGLRQAIVERMDEGSREGFLFLLRIILEQDLLRYASVVRALDVWTGLLIQTEKPGTVRKCLQTAIACLESRQQADACIESDDPLLIHLGLWAIAFNEIMECEQPIRRILESDWPETSGRRHRKLAALYFLRQTQNRPMQDRIADMQICSANAGNADDEILAWSIDNLHADQTAAHLRYAIMVKNAPAMQAVAGPETVDRIACLKLLAERLTRTGRTFNPSVHPWASITLSAVIVLDKMVLTAFGHADTAMLDGMIGLMDKMNVDARFALIAGFLAEPKTAAQREAVIKAMGDRSQEIRETACKIVEHLSLTESEYVWLEGLLTGKSGDLRKNVISTLLRMPTEPLLKTLQRLAESRDVNQRLGAIDIALAMSSHTVHQAQSERGLALVAAIVPTTQQERLQLEKLPVPALKTANQPDRQPAWQSVETGPPGGVAVSDLAHAPGIDAPNPAFASGDSLATGFGLFDPAKCYRSPEIAPPDRERIRRILGPESQAVKELLKALSDGIHENRTHEYAARDFNGQRSLVLLGDGYGLQPLFTAERDDRSLRLEDYPLAALWRSIFDRYSAETIVLARFMIDFNSSVADFGLSRTVWYNLLRQSAFPLQSSISSPTSDSRFLYQSIAGTLLDVRVAELDPDLAAAMGQDILRHLYAKIPADRYTKSCLRKRSSDMLPLDESDDHLLVKSSLLDYWLNLVQSPAITDDRFRECFAIAYRFYESSQYKANPLRLETFARAFHLGIITRDELLAQLMSRPKSNLAIREATDDRWNGRPAIRDWPQALATAAEAIDRIVGIEVQRGELVTPVSHLAARIICSAGAVHFVSILMNAEKDPYVRGYNFVDGDATRRQMLSHLLKGLHPLPGEDAGTLRTLLAGKRMSEQQLVDAAMYAPQWLPIVEAYLDWPGLRSAGWYFHAHVSENFTAEKAAVVARFSPIDPNDLREGAFDLEWFREAYGTLGANRFKRVYAGAKYIADGSLHRRSQLFADAVIGALDRTETETQIKASRNRDRLLAYSLIPVQGLDDALQRYRFIRQYAKEARQYGSQRQASETRAATLALTNLARNAGYADANRFSWRMETESLADVRAFFQPMPIADICLSIQVDDKGSATLLVEKDGWPIKNVPSNLKNHETVEQAKAVLKQLKEQHQRARASLENAMVQEDAFTFGEINDLTQNPVLAPLLRALVFQCGDRFGFLEQDRLVAAGGQAIQLKESDVLTIAHPYHLYRAHIWPDYQKLLFDRQTVQPIRQVFRELYLPTEDEQMERTLSRRYAGHQIQPRKTLSLLKARGWSASPETGLQKVHHRQNIVVEIFAEADWFSPAELEAPAIESVRFFHRQTGEPLVIENLPAVLFSEVMRDVDLVVSVAHAGGVDPEASHSTVEMRAAILEGLLPLLKLDNVRLQGAHAIIAGHFGEYSVHLGSGIVHMPARGAIHIIAVHAGQRGRIFLPFVDDDPKTAEVITKTIFLAEDRKIKDPSILSQIVP